MRVAVIGGTGLTGRHTVEALKRLGHDVVIVSRSHGVDILTNEGLDAALAGAAAVIDVTSFEGADFDTVRATFAKGTSNLLAAEQRAGVRHHILLSIVNVDTIKGNPHYAGKRAQEELVSGGPIPFTIQRATQFYEFPRWWSRGIERAMLPWCRRCSCSRWLLRMSGLCSPSWRRGHRSDGRRISRGRRRRISSTWCVGFSRRVGRRFTSCRVGGVGVSGLIARAKCCCLGQMRASRR